MCGAFVLTFSLVAFAPVAAQETAPMTASAVYSAMVRSMAREAAPTTMTYRETVVPHGLTLTIAKRGRATVPTLVFSSSEAHEEFAVRRTPVATEVLDVTSGLRYTGSRIFWAASWSDARAVAARTGEAPAPSVTATPSVAPSDEGATSTVDRLRAGVIGDVTTISDRYYRVDDAGSADIDGTAVRHLHLVARADTTNHPLTDLYVDTDTFLLRRAVAAFKNEAVVSGYAGTMTLDFGRVDAFWMVVGGQVRSAAHVLLTRVSGSADFSIHDVAILP